MDESYTSLPTSHLLGSVTVLLLIPVEILWWIIIILTAVASASFVSLNIKSFIEADLMIVVVAAFALRVALALFIKIWFFP